MPYEFVPLCHSKILVCVPKLAHNSGSGMKLPVVGAGGGGEEEGLPSLESFPSANSEF